MNGPSVTVNGALGQNGCETEPVWERPWTLEEIHKASGSWSLGADAGLLLFLQDFSQRMLSRTHEIEKQLDGLIQHTKATDSRLHNVFNDFLMLSNIQFIENRVYDEEVEEAAKPESGGKPVEPERTREQKEAELIPKVQEAVRYGLRVLDSAFEQLDIKAGNSDSEDEETNERVEHLLEPKDLYIDRPLPYIIGSQQFMEEEDVGLGDLSSEESVDSERGSVIESEEEKEEESVDDFADESEEDEQKLPKLARKQQLISDEDEDDDSDLFHESEKEDDDEDATSTKKMGQTSFAEELAARIQGESPEKPDEERASLTSGGSATKNRVKIKKETRKAKCQDDENLFTSENADESDVYSPFYSKGGLFSGGKGLFDDDEGDLFAEAPKEELDEGKEVKPAVSNEPAVRKSGKKVPVGAISIYPGGDLFGGNVISETIQEKEAKKKAVKAPPASEPADAAGLFDEEEDGDLFGSNVKTSTLAPIESKLAASLFDDSEDSGLFEASVTPKPVKEKSRAPQNAEPQSEVVESSPPLAEKSQTSSGLFSDEEESQDLFSSNKDTKRRQSKQSSKGQIRSNQVPISFFDDDEGDLFAAAPSKDISPAKKSQQLREPKPPASGSKATALFGSDDKSEWQSAGPQTPVDGEAVQPPLRKEVAPKAAAASRAPKKTSLFENDHEEDYLFDVTQQESQKKSQKVSLLFEEEDGGDLFASKPAASKPAASQKPAAPPQGSSLFSEVVENDSVGEFDGKRQVNQGVGSKPRLVEAARLFAGTDAPEQLANKKVLDSDSVTSQEDDAVSRPSTTGWQEELQSSLNSVVSLFDEEDDDNPEDSLSQSSLANADKLPESGVSTRVFLDEELLFSHHQQKDNDPDVDLFADALKPEVKKPGIKPPVHPLPAPRTRPTDLPSSDLFDTTDSLLSTTKPWSTKASSSTASIFEDAGDEDLFRPIPAKPPVTRTKPVPKGTETSRDASPKISEPPKKASGEVLSRERPEEKERLTNKGPIKPKGPSSRIGKLQASLAINPARLLPGASPKVAGVAARSAPISSPPGVSPLDGSPSGLSPSVATASGPAASEGVTESFDQPLKVDTLPSVVKSRARVVRKRRPPTRGARRLAAQQSDETEEREQRSETDGALSGEGDLSDISPTVLAHKPRSDKALPAKRSRPPEASPDKDAGPLSAATVKLPVHSDLFGSGDRVKPSLPQGLTPAVEPRENSLPKKEPDQSIFAPSEGNLFQPSKRVVMKPKAAAFPEEDPGDDIFGTAKSGKTKSTQKSSKSMDIFEDDLFATESVTLAKKSNEESTDVNLFADHVDIFADLKVAPKEKKSRKKVETKSIFDDDMDDIFASAASSASTKKQSKPKSRSSQAAAPSSTPDSKAADIFDDPLNVFGP
uniref:WASH complex subunit 2A isoform X2 n=1 Tax=Pristiophorus japonicus TaxID=55135 RepID=UPI00398F4D25